MAKKIVFLKKKQRAVEFRRTSVNPWYRNTACVLLPDSYENILPRIFVCFLLAQIMPQHGCVRKQAPMGRLGLTFMLRGARKGWHSFISTLGSTIRTHLPWWGNWTSQGTTNCLEVLLKMPLQIQSWNSLDTKLGHGVLILFGLCCQYSDLSKYNIWHALDTKTTTFNFLQAFML